MQPVDRQPPQDLDAERALLGSLLMHDAVGSLDWTHEDIFAVLPGAEVFYLPDHRTVYRCIAEAVAACEPMDLVTMRPRLEAAGSCTSGDWGVFTTTLAESFSDAANAVHYARRVREAHSLREVIRSCYRGIADAHEPLAESAVVVDTLSRRIESIGATSSDAKPISVATLISQLQNPRHHRHELVPVGLGPLGDRLDGGLEVGTLTTIGARPGCGKTSLGLGLCHHAVHARGGCPALFTSIEMTSTQVAQRLVAMGGGAPMRHLRSGGLDDAEFDRVCTRAADHARGGQPFFVVDRVRRAPAIAAMIRQYARSHAVKLVVIDFLQLVEMPGTFDRNVRRLGAISKLLKATAVDAGVAIVLLSQLNRSAENEQRPPRIADIREAGECEEDSDNVVLLHKLPDSGDAVCRTDVIVAKQRQGTTGIVTLGYRKSTMSYETIHAIGS